MDTQIGEHYWAEIDGKLLVVLREKGGYEVCGPWECGLTFGDCGLVILSHIPRPPRHEGKGLYYA